ncbi:toll/interleukin-1 receptor domain-containing protein [Neptunomonas qingdaonensis]|uniref:TIR domain-containing protein n=1 Tax=Neptunomonas qingdaonensis TaxID=1045558 RepID=A0A1I2TNW5_9GAMM|nr:toll/interleukin-1 receptor domain-containing protein [Neptunomonas qingdaonensis]SFG66594.1 TIR domain-containing protein [Neptunomonas qingdaonensis]
MSHKDVFICHASEDKDSYIKPLTELLKDNGITFWIDSQDLRLGEHLDQSIPQALNNARFGLVIFSKAFLSKEWTNRELQLIRDKEEAENEIILLPILEDISQELILTKYGFLRDRKFLKWTELNKLIDDLKHYLQGTAVPNNNLLFSDALSHMSRFNAVMHWTARPVPQKETKQFFTALQRFFIGYNIFLEGVSDSLTSAVDNLCRVLCTADNFDGYSEGKLAISIGHCSTFLSGSPDQDMDLPAIIYYCDRAIDSSSNLSKKNRSVLTIYLILLRYLQSYSDKRGYHLLHHDVGNQLHSLFSNTLPFAMAAALPTIHDEYEWDRIYEHTKKDWLKLSSDG